MRFSVHTQSELHTEDGGGGGGGGGGGATANAHRIITYELAHAILFHTFCSHAK